MYLNTELLLYVMLYGFKETDNIGPGSTPEVDQHQCLLIVDTSTAERPALPSTLFDHPSGRNLLVRTVYCIVRHTLVLRRQFIVFLLGDDGIHKEAARIPRHLGVGKFGITDGDNRLSQLVCRRVCNTPFC